MQQTTVELMGGHPSPWAVIAITTPIVWLLAQASWHLVEAPALKHKPRPTAGLVS